MTKQGFVEYYKRNHPKEIAGIYSLKFISVDNRVDVYGVVSLGLKDDNVDYQSIGTPYHTAMDRVSPIKRKLYNPPGLTTTTKLNKWLEKSKDFTLISIKS